MTGCPTVWARAIAEDEIFVRFVLSYATPEADVRKFLALIKELQCLTAKIKKGRLLEAPPHSGLGRLFRLKHFLLIRAANGNRARLQGFRNFALQRNMQQAMIQISAGHFYVIGKLEAALKIAGRQCPDADIRSFRQAFQSFCR